MCKNYEYFAQLYTFFSGGGGGFSKITLRKAKCRKQVFLLAELLCNELLLLLCYYLFIYSVRGRHFYTLWTTCIYIYIYKCENHLILSKSVLYKLTIFNDQVVHI